MNYVFYHLFSSPLSQNFQPIDKMTDLGQLENTEPKLLTFSSLFFWE